MTRSVSIRCGCLLALLCLAPVAIAMEGERAWRVEDSVSIRHIVGDMRLTDWPEQGPIRPVQAAPDGEHFFILTRRGDVTCDCNRYELRVYSTAHVRRGLADGSRSAPLEPLHTVRMNSTAWISERGAIRQVVWEDSKTLRFMGTGEMGSTLGVFRFDVRRGVLQRLTDADHHVESYDVHRDTILYIASQLSARPRDEDGLPLGYNGYPVQPLRGGGFGGGGLAAFLDETPFNRRMIGTFAARRGEKARVISPYTNSDRVRIEFLTPHMSPDGRWGVASIPVEGGEVVPAGWELYAGLEAPHALLMADELSRLRRLTLVNMTSGEARVMVDAPLGPRSTGAGLPADVLWSADSKHVVLVNAGLPLTESVAERGRIGYLLDYDVGTGRWSVIEPMVRAGDAAPVNGPGAAVAAGARVSRVGWLREGRELLVTRVDRAGKPAEGTRYTLKGGQWIGRAVAATVKVPAKAPPSGVKNGVDVTFAGGVKVSFRESANDPQAVVASNGVRELSLLEPDPALQGIWRAREQDVQWNEHEGMVRRGALVLPREGTATKPYPLVIQIAAALSNRFRPDGTTPTAFAKQALVAHGIAVLEVDGETFETYANIDGIKDIVDNARWMEGSLIRERLDAAVASLARQGLIDPKRVGLVGFSRTGFQTYYVITHPLGFTPAAAIVADSVTASYAETVVGAAIGYRDRKGPTGIEMQYGGPFWENKTRWLEHAPGFNVDKVETPTLFAYNGNFNNWEILEAVGAFRLNRREVDALLFPKGVHQLVLPRQRMVSMQATVDWMAFWLTGREDASPQKAEQYWYWRSLRAQRDARQSANGSARGSGAGS